MGAWTQPRPVGLFGINDLMALEALDLLEESGLAVPDAVRVVGFDNTPEADEHRPGLSSVAPDSRGIGFHAGGLLEAWIRAGARPPAEILLPPLGVEERDSTGGDAFRDPVIRKLARLIRSRMAEPLRVEEFARIAGCSRRTLEARFRQVTGTSPYHFLLEKRLQRARQLLRDTDQPVQPLRYGYWPENTHWRAGTQIGLGV